MKQELPVPWSDRPATATSSDSVPQIPAGTTLRAYLLRLAWADDDWADPEPA